MTWVKYECILLSERNETPQIYILYGLLYITIWKRQNYIGMENSLVVPKNWEKRRSRLQMDHKAVFSAM